MPKHTAKQIVIDVSPDGEIRIETKGYEGPACMEDSQFIKDILGVGDRPYESIRCSPNGAT